MASNDDQEQTCPVEGSVFETVRLVEGVNRVALVKVIAVGLFLGKKYVFYTADSCPGEIGVRRIDAWDEFLNAHLHREPVSIDPTVVMSEIRGSGLFYARFRFDLVKRGDHVFFYDYTESGSQCQTTTH